MLSLSITPSLLFPPVRDYLTWYSSLSWSKNNNRLMNIKTWCPVSNPMPLGISLCPILLPWDKNSPPIGKMPLLLMYLEIVTSMAYGSPSGRPHGHHSGPWCTALLLSCIYNAKTKGGRMYCITIPLWLPIIFRPFKWAFPVHLQWTRNIKSTEASHFSLASCHLSFFSFFFFSFFFFCNHVCTA